MKSIKLKILALAMSLLLVSIVVISVTSILSTYNSTMFALEESMNATIDATADMVEVQLGFYATIANQFANDPVFSQEIPEEGEETADGKTRDDVHKEYLEHSAELMELHNFESIDVFSSDGIALNAGIDFSSESIFTIPRDTGMPYVGDPIMSPETGMLTMTVTAPIMRNGQFAGVVLFAINPQVFSEIVSSVSVGEGSTVTIINSAGNTIAYNDIQLVFDAYNATEEAKSDASLQPLADMEQDLINGGEGFASVKYDGMDWFAAYTQVDDSNGWGIYVLAHQEVFLAQMISSIIMIIVLSVVIFIVSAFITIAIVRKISKPITLCADRLNLVSQGDLSSPMPEINSSDETGVLAASTASIVNSISVMINDLNHTLSEIAAGNFTVESSAREYYIGDFSSLLSSLDEIVRRLSTTMVQINAVSNQVSDGNHQVALGSQSLAQGAVEQASAIEELSATIEDISQKITETASDSLNAKNANEKSQTALTQSNEQMRSMVEAMANITEKSMQISNIIKAIDDIAFQTNILSLNASVEAARAGSAGRSFAVVADEVRSLATKSAQSASDTAVLIEETVAAVEVGSRIATSTSESINIAIESANELSNLVDSIADASTTQSEGAKQISIGIDQISAVIQTNSATAEESAATSEELSSQSQILKDLLSGFSLSNQNNETL